MSGGHVHGRRVDLEKHYCEGVKASVDSQLQNTNPWNQTTQPEEYAAWDQGWVDHNGGSYDLSCCGYPVAGKPAPGQGAGDAPRP